MIVADHRMQEHVASETIQCDNSMINRALLQEIDRPIPPML